MAHSEITAESGLRRYLIEQRSELRALFTNTLLDDSAASAQVAWTEMSKGVDPLIAGKAVLVRRYELPDDHPQAAPSAGHPCEWLLLDENDVLRIDDRPGIGPIPNRQRRR